MGLGVFRRPARAVSWYPGGVPVLCLGPDGGFSRSGWKVRTDRITG